MLTNLFTLFDPAYRSPFKYTINWFSPLLLILIYPITYLPIKTRTNWFFNKIIILLWIDYTKKLNKKRDSAGFNFIFCLFLTFLIANIILIWFPYSWSSTCHIAFPLSLSFTLLICTFFAELKNNPIKTLSSFIPKRNYGGILIIVFIVITDTIRYFIRPFVIAMRLTRNIIAGNVMIYVFAYLITILNSIIPFLGIVIICWLVSVLKIFFCFVQSYVFIVLIILYVTGK